MQSQQQVEDDDDIYEPNAENKPHYEKLLSILRRVIGSDAATTDMNILADDVLYICNDPDVAFANRREALEQLTGTVPLAPEVVRDISSLTGKITDYVTSAKRQALLQQDSAATGTGTSAATNNNNRDAMAAAVAAKQPVVFQVGNVLERSLWQRRGGAAGANDNEDLFDVDDLLLGGEGGDGGAASDGLERQQQQQLEFLFNPLLMQPTFLTDELTRLFPDKDPSDRQAIEKLLRDRLGNQRNDDAVLRTMLPLDVNPESNPEVAAFLSQVIDYRWHIHYGLHISETEPNSDQRAAVVDQLREHAHMHVPAGDRAAYLTRRSVRMVLKLASPNSKLDNLVDDDADAAAMLPSSVDDINNDTNVNAGAASGRNKGDKSNKILRRGDELNIVNLEDHHPIGRANNNNASGGGGGGAMGAADHRPAFLKQSAGQQLVLPPGTKSDTFDTHIEVVVPQPQRVPSKPNDSVKVSIAFPKWARVAFPESMTHLNVMQTKVYKSVFRSDRNSLICAPTGAGKTNVAVMSILRALEKFGEFEDKNDDGDDDGNSNNNMTGDDDRVRYLGPGTGWKVVYIAPMLALAREVTASLSNRFGALGVAVSELTGDSALSPSEMKDIHVLVATPEKWDIISRKTLDLGAAAEVKLIIFDEVHMLHSERGAVVESIAARTLNQVERTCEPVRFVGLSATLPNYEDVAQFLRVNVRRNGPADLEKGDLHFFHGGYRPVPLTQTFCCPAPRGQQRDPTTGKTYLSKKSATSLNDLTFLKVREMLERGPIIVFVHSRKDTVSTAQFILEKAIKSGFQQTLAASVGDLTEEKHRAKSAALAGLLPHGLCVHHAGMTLEDKRMVERLFGERRMSVLVSTATLAWGVNLPAHTVIIKGTKVYSASNGGWTDLSILDTLQMFGRAGRPTLDTSGDAVILTSDRENLEKYLKFLTVQDPVESHLMLKIMEAINAEVALGSVSNMEQCVKWFKCTWFYTRLCVAPRLYGVIPSNYYAPKNKQDADSAVTSSNNSNNQRLDLTPLVEDICHTALKKLHACELVQYVDVEGTVHPLDLGRITSFFNLTFETTRNIVTRLSADMQEHEIFDVFARCAEFASIRVRDEELNELREKRKRCPMPIEGDDRDGRTKVNILTQLAISGATLDGHILASDLAFIKDDSSTRVSKAIHEICLIKGWANTANIALKFHQQLKNRQWDVQCPLRQFYLAQHSGGSSGSDDGDSAAELLPFEVIRRLEAARIDWPRLKLSDPENLQQMIGGDINTSELAYGFVQKIPQLCFVHVVHVAQSRSLLKLEAALVPDFEYDDAIHGGGGGGGMSFLLTIEDGDGRIILFQEKLQLSKHQLEHQTLVTIPCFVQLTNPKPACYFARCVALDWLASTTTQTIDLRDLTLPEPAPAPTKAADFPDSPEDCPCIDNPHDHEALFGDLADDGWNTPQLTAFQTLYRSSSVANTMVSAPLGCGRQAMMSMVLAQFLERCDLAHERGEISSAGSQSEAVKMFSGRFLHICPNPEAAFRRFEFWRDAMRKSDEERRAAASDAGGANNNNNNTNNNNLKPRNCRVAFLTGASSIDSEVLAAAPLIRKKDQATLSSSSPLIVVATPLRLLRLAAVHPEIYEAFDVVQCDGLHTICSMPTPPPEFGVLGDQQGGGDANAHENDDGNTSKHLGNDDEAVNYLTPSSCLWKEGTGVRYADLIQGFVEAQQRRMKLVAAAEQQQQQQKQDNASSNNNLLSSRIVGFASVTVHAADVLGKLIKAKEVLQLSSRDYQPRSIALELQEIPRHADREASARNHVFRLLTEKRYEVSSVLVFTPTQRQAEEMAEHFMLQFRSEDLVLHPQLLHKRDPRRRQFDDEDDGNDDHNDEKEEGHHAKKNIQDDLLRDYLPSGVGLITSDTSNNDSKIIFSTARKYQKLVCFCPVSCAGRVPSSAFEYVFVCSSQTLSAQGVLSDVDVNTMLQLTSRSAIATTVWCSTNRKDFWNRALTGVLPCLPLLSVSLCPSFRPFLQAHADNDEQLATELMSHFVAENLLDYCFHEVVSAAASGGGASSTTTDEEQLFIRIKKNVVFLAARFSPFAYGLDGPSGQDAANFFAAVNARAFRRLAALRTAKQEVVTVPPQGENSDEQQQQDQDLLIETTFLTPTLFGRVASRYQLAAVDCGRLFKFCAAAPATAAQQQQQQEYVPSEASVLYLVCQTSCVSSTVSSSVDERQPLRDVCHFFSSKKQLPRGFRTHDSGTGSGKALMLALMFCTGKFVHAQSGVLLADDTNEENDDDDEQHLVAVPSTCRKSGLESFATFVFGDANMSQLMPSEWISEQALVVERILLVLPAVVEFFSKKDLAWLNVAVSLSRKLHCGGRPLLPHLAHHHHTHSHHHHHHGGHDHPPNNSNNTEDDSSAVELNNHFSHFLSPLRQLPGFDDDARLQLAQELEVYEPQQVVAVDDDVREKLFAGLHESAVQSIAQWCNDCPVIESSAVTKYDANTDVVAIRVVVESAVAADDGEEEDGGNTTPTLSQIACTPRLTHLLRMAGATTVVSSGSASFSSAATSSLPVGVPARFLVVARLASAPEVVKASRIVSLTSPREVIDLRFKLGALGTSSSSSDVDGANGRKILIDVQSLAYEVSSQCSCEA